MPDTMLSASSQLPQWALNLRDGFHRARGTENPLSADCPPEKVEPLDGLIGSPVVREVSELGRKFRGETGIGVWETSQVKTKAKQETAQPACTREPCGAQLGTVHTALRT